MNVLMFGWEFPPLSSGGLGTACYGLTKSLSKKGVGVILVVPYAEGMNHDFLKVVSANIKIRKVNSLLRPYLNSAEYKHIKEGSKMPFMYGANLFEEVRRYEEAADEIARKENFDVIHCHDWMTYGAGIRAKEISKKPLIIHVHATEFDRTGGSGVNQYVYDMEKRGMVFSDLIIAVSNFTKNKIVQHYGIDPNKIMVVHNAINPEDTKHTEKLPEIKKHSKIVLFLGRVTLQKGPDYFIYAAKKVLKYEPNTIFIIAGSGDMERFIIEKAAEMGISNKVLFAGFLKGDDVDKAYRMADLYVMPSVSEPFGLTALEAISNNVPVIISKQSGVSEVIKHCLTADFWDVNELANKILAALRYRVLHDSLIENASYEIKKFSWDEPAGKCIEAYNKVSGAA